MILSVLALSALIWQLPMSASLSQPATVQSAAITVTAEDDGSGGPIGGVAITITVVSSDSRRLTFKGTTFADGKAEFPDLAPGRYIVTASSSELLAAPSLGIGDPQRSISLKPGAQEVVAFSFRRPAVIWGQVLTPTGSPVQGATVEVVMTKSEVRGRPVVEAGPGSSTDAEGRFRIEKLVPGQYLVRARLPASVDGPMNFVYAPRTIASNQATPVILDAGADVSVAITALAVPAVAVGGRVVNAGGEPVQNATVTLTSVDEDEIPGGYVGPRWPYVSAGINPPETVRTDGSGRFVVSGVREGLYALQAVVRGTGSPRPVVAAGVAEVEVGSSTIDSLTITLLPCARITGRFFFNGLETADPGRPVVVMRPDGEDAYLRKGLASTTNWRADGTFAIDGLLGRHRLTVRPSGSWFTVGATLDNGTDIATAAFDFEPGKTYGDVRVRMSDETAEIEGLMPEGWSPDSHLMVMVFPDDMSLWQDNRQYIQTGSIIPQTRRFSVKRIPPGHMYLVALYPFFEAHDPRAGSQDILETLNELWPRATRIFIGEAGRFEVTLAPLPRDR